MQLTLLTGRTDGRRLPAIWKPTFQFAHMDAIIQICILLLLRVQQGERYSVMNPSSQDNGRGFPTAADIFLGLGIGGVFDGIILHQVLQ